MNHIDSHYRNLDHTLRRYYIDEFFYRQFSSIPDGSLILDLGGNKIQKRGLFDIDRLNHRVIYVNLSDEKKPDVLADAASLPFGENTFDVVICAELLEHVCSPEFVLREIMRVLKSSGILLITVPFLVPYHADPYDFGRYSDQYWKRMLRDVGFVQIRVEKQGYFWSVFLDMLRGYIIQLQTDKSRRTWGLLPLVKKLIVFARLIVVAKETFPKLPEKIFYQNYTTGYGVFANKQ